MRPAPIAIATVSLVLVALLAGCGGGDAPSTTAASGGGPATAACPAAESAATPVQVAFRNDTAAAITLAVDPGTWSCSDWSGDATPGSLQGVEVPPNGRVVTRSLTPATAGPQATPPGFTVQLVSGGTVVRSQQLVLRQVGDGATRCWAAPGTAGCPGFTSAVTLPDGTAARVVSTPTEARWRTPADNPVTLTPNGPGLGRQWLVTLGDSYMSGLGARWAGNTGGSTGAGWRRVDALGPRAYWDSPTGEKHPGCYRAPGGAPAHVGDDTAPSQNFACGGATTRSFPGKKRVKPGVDFYAGADGVGQLVDLRRFAMDHNVRMIAVSIGGNDLKFAAIVQSCLSSFLVSRTPTRRLCSEKSDKVRQALSPENVAKVTEEIRSAYRRIGTAMAEAGYAPDQYTVVALDYPDIIAPPALMKYREAPGIGRQVVGGCGMWDKDITWVQGTMLPTLTRAIDDAAAGSGLADVRRMRLAKQYVGHRLCEKGTELVPAPSTWRDAGAVERAEWITQIRSLTAGFAPYDIDEGAHRNYWGNLSLRNCLRQEWKAIASGSPSGNVECVPAGGVEAGGEPSMRLAPSP